MTSSALVKSNAPHCAACCSLLADLLCIVMEVAAFERVDAIAPFLHGLKNAATEENHHSTVSQSIPWNRSYYSAHSRSHALTLVLPR